MTIMLRTRPWAAALLLALSTLPAGLVNGPTGIVLTRGDLAIKDHFRAGQTYTVKIDGFTGHSYQLEYSPDLAAPFAAVGLPQVGITGTELTFSVAAAGQRGFFRLSLTP